MGAMNKLKFNSQVCTTIEQSQRLLELGLKPETADCQYAALVVDWQGRSISNPKWRFYDHNEGFAVQNFEHMERIPAWSLHRLLCMLDYDDANTFNIMPNLAYEDVIATISLRIGCGAFNKEYLKQ